MCHWNTKMKMDIFFFFKDGLFLYIKYIKNFINDDFLFSRKVNKSYHTKEKKTTKYFDDSLGFSRKHILKQNFKMFTYQFLQCQILYHPNVPNICTEWRHHFLINKKTFFAEILTNYKSSRRRCFCQKYLFFWPKINCGMRMSHLWNKPFITLSRHERFYIFSLSILVISVFIIPMAL